MGIRYCVSCNWIHFLTLRIIVRDARSLPGGAIAAINCTGHWENQRTITLDRIGVRQSFRFYLSLFVKINRLGLGNRVLDHSRSMVVGKSRQHSEAFNELNCLFSSVDDNHIPETQGLV